jgi:hypothetical protein
MPTVYDELVVVTKLKVKAGIQSDREELAKAFSEKVARLPDEEWEELSEETKDWYNGLVSADMPMTEEIWEGLSEGSRHWHDEITSAREAGELLPFPGFPEEIGVPETLEEDEDEEVSETQPGEKPKMSKAATKRVTRVTAAATRASNGSTRKTRKERTEPARRGRRGRFDPDLKITVLGDNPRREKSKVYALHAQLKSGMTVQDALDAGLSHGNLAREIELKAIKIG